jgi:hypothetical protein
MEMDANDEELQQRRQREKSVEKNATHVDCR